LISSVERLARDVHARTAKLLSDDDENMTGSLNMDGWQTRARRGFLGIIYTFVGSDFRVYAVLLRLQPLPVDGTHAVSVE
jgi:hypothetical protein